VTLSGQNYCRKIGFHCGAKAQRVEHEHEQEPTGRQIEVPLVGIFEFDGDRLMCEKVYFDMATWTRQLQAPE
jgi:limonene-1,2-epoxide hydrolase